MPELFPKEERDRLYQMYVRPLESAQWGKFAAVAGDGDVVLGDSVLDAMRNGHAAPGHERMIFKVGERVAGRIR